jgi:hypothetical protein
MGVYTEAVQKLYVAYFNRPADAAGLTYWEGVVAANKGSTAAVSASFAASAEYKAAYAGMDEYHVVAQVYQNLFGHAPDLDGLNYWGQLLIKKQITIDNVVAQIAGGAQGTDKEAYANKVAAATAFTAALDTPAEVLGYSGDAANALAKTFISGVTTADSLKAAIDPVALNATVQSIIDAQAQTTGKSFALTAGLDTIVGTAGNDTINVYNIDPVTGNAATNLSSFDSIDGGAGKDTLNLDLTGGNNTITGTIKNVEVINLIGNAGSVDASSFQGATNLNLLGGTATVTKLAANTVAGFNATAGNISVGAAGASASIALTNVAETAGITVTGSSLNSVTVSGARVDSDDSGALAAQALNITVGTDVQAVTVNTNQSTTLSLTSNGKAITSLDASASTGKIAVTGDTNLATIKTGSAGDTVTVATTTAAATSSAAAVNATVSTGAGDDIITVSTTGTGLTSVDGGAGKDAITVNKVTGAGLNVLGGEGDDTITVNGVLETTDVINGGAGTDTIQLAGATARAADDYIVFNKLVTGFETIKFSSAETGLDASKLAANYTTINLFAGSAITGVGTQAIVANGTVGLTAAGYSTGASGTTYAGTLAVTEGKAGTVTANADVLNLTVKASATANSAVVLNGDVQTAAVTLTNTVDSATTPTVDRLASLTVNTGTADAALKSLTLSGTGSASVTNADGAKLTTVDASALGGTLTVAGTATQGLTYVSTNTAVETVKLGSGLDKITIGASTYGAVDTITGLKLAVSSTTGNLTAGSDQLNITALGATAVSKMTTTQTDLDLALKDAAASAKTNVVFQMGGDTYVFHDAGTVGKVDALDTVVKLTGAIDLDVLIKALGTPIV